MGSLFSKVRAVKVECYCWRCSCGRDNLSLELVDGYGNVCSSCACKSQVVEFEHADGTVLLREDVA